MPAVGVDLVRADRSPVRSLTTAPAGPRAGPAAVGARVHDADVTTRTSGGTAGGTDAAADPTAVLAGFSPATRAWFTGAFDAPTPAQAGAWAAAQAGEHALVVAPTGSGKTLAAFLWALDGLATAAPPEDPRRRCRVLYVSPLKALAVDVQRNLRSPLTGIRQEATRLGLTPPDVTVGTRSGDTPAAERRNFLKIGRAHV